jgi:hypothetical protein
MWKEGAVVDAMQLHMVLISVSAQHNGSHDTHANSGLMQFSVFEILQDWD